MLATTRGFARPKVDVWSVGCILYEMWTAKVWANTGCVLAKLSLGISDVHSLSNALDSKPQSRQTSQALFPGKNSVDQLTKAAKGWKACRSRRLGQARMVSDGVGTWEVVGCL